MNLLAAAITALLWVDPATGDATAISSYAPPPAGVVATVPASRSVALPVPFLVQAPGDAWNDPVLADACEEASVLMAAAWARGEHLDVTAGVARIRAMAAFEEQRFGTFVDTSAADTAALLYDYLGLKGVELHVDVGVEDLRALLATGAVVIVPVDGRLLGNPNYRGGGPPRHVIVLRGFDDAAGTFLANDPGTVHGAGVAYDAATLDAALRDYPTGVHPPVLERRTAAIVVRR